MKRFFALVSVVLLTTSLLLTGCFGNNQVSESDISSVNVYYISESGSDLVADTISVPDISKKGQIKFLVEQLIHPPVGKVSPLSRDTKLRSVSLKDEIAVVDFSDDFMNIDELKLTLAPVSVAKTLCGLSFVSGVEILVEGEPVTGIDGKPIGVILESDLVLGDAGASKDSEVSFVLYFSNESAEFLVPERRTVKLTKGDTVEKAVLDALIKGPEESNHSKTVPPETKLLSVETKDNVCFVNLSKEFVNKHSGGVAAEQLTVYSIVNSLTELGTVDKVQFLIEGEKKEEFIHMVFNEPIVRNKSIIRQ